MSKETKRQKVLVSSIGKNVLTPEERDRKNYERQIMLKTGVLQPWFDGPLFDVGDYKGIKMHDDRFSTMYETFEEYQHDRMLVGNIVLADGYAPEELVDKVGHTTNELYNKALGIGDTL